MKKQKSAKNAIFTAHLTLRDIKRTKHGVNSLAGGQIPKPQVEGSTPFGGTIYLLNKGFSILCNPCNKAIESVDFVAFFLSEIG